MKEYNETWKYTADYGIDRTFWVRMLLKFVFLFSAVILVVFIGSFLI